MTTDRAPTRRTVAAVLLVVGLLVAPVAPAVAAPVPAPAASAATTEVLSDPCAPRVALPAGRARCYAVERVRVVRDARTGAVTPAAPAAAPVGGITPVQLQRAYGVNGLVPPAGTTVGIVVPFDTPTVESDLAAFRAQYGLPPCTTAGGCFRKVDERGVTVPANKSRTSTARPVYDAGWQVETTLDTQAVSAMCPSCSILLVEADDTSLTASLGPAVARAQALGATVISNSFGGGESQDETQADATYWARTTVPVFAASGDGAHDDDFGGALYPAVSPSVTTVGGTSASIVGGALTSETSWELRQDADTRTWSGPGSGCSVVFTRPAYQADYFTKRGIDPYPYVTSTDFGCNIPGQAVTPARAYSDVSALADPYAPGFPLLLQGGWSVAGGTSLSVQLVAALAAYAGPRGTSTPVNDVAYGLAAANAPTGLVDVTAGSNRVPGSADRCGTAPICNARGGWDGPTGLGTPRGLSVFAPLLTLTPSTTVPGGTVTASGSDFVPGETVVVLAADGTVLAGTHARADGTYAVRVALPAAATAPVTLSVAGYTSGFTASRTLPFGTPTLAAVAAADPTGQVVPLEPVTARISNFAAREVVRVTVAGGGPVTVTTDATGAARIVVTVPVTAAGSVGFQATGTSSGFTAGTTLPVVPAGVSPGYQTVRINSVLTLSASGFGSGESVSVTDGVGAGVPTVATATAAVNGTATLRWTPDATVDPGTRKLVIRGGRTNRVIAVLANVLTSGGTPPATPTVLSAVPTTAGGAVIGVRVAAGAAVTGVRVLAPDGTLYGPATVNATGDAFVQVTGLALGTTATYRAVAGNDVGDSPPSAVSAGVTANTAPGTGDFTPVGPVRRYDSRTGNQPLGQRGTRVIAMAGVAGVPAQGVSAVVVSVTVLSGPGSTYLTLWPAGEALPNVSNANAPPNAIKSSLAKVKLGAGGAISVYNDTASVHFILDVVGFYAAAPASGGSSSTFAHNQSYAGLANPVRVADTRNAPSPVRSGPGTLVVPIRDGVSGVASGVPADATSVELNVQAVDSTALSFLTVFPTGLPGGVPNVSNVQFAPGRPTITAVVAGIGVDGTVSVYANGGTEVIVDVVGYYSPSAAGRFVPISPRRYYDSRPYLGGQGPFGTGTVRAVPLAGAAALDGSRQVPSSAAAVSFSLTSSDNSDRTVETAWATGTPQPFVTSLLPDPAAGIYDNLVLSAVGAGGAVSLWNRVGAVDLIVDVQGYYTTGPS